MKNFQFSIFNFQKIVIFFLLALVGLAFTQTVSADTVTDNALNYLKSKQDATGQITGGGFSNASPWSAIAFSAYDIDINTVKNPTNSILSYLIDHQPTTSLSAFEWEKWILAIVASGYNPYDFAGVDYVATLKSPTYYTLNQIGDNSGVNDDFFGVLALVASKVDVTDPILTDAVVFILANQNADGGWGYALKGGDSDSNDTAAAIQALVAAKNYGVVNANLDNAIANAKTFLLSKQDPTGGFLSDKWSFAPDSVSTSWALLALNVLEMKGSSEANLARTWQLSQQSGSDGGFLACQYNPPDYICELVSNSTVTADTLVALSGKGWIVKEFDQATAKSTPTVTPTITDTPTITPTPSTSSGPTATPTPGSSSNNSTSSGPTATPTPTPATTSSDSTTTLASLLSSPLATTADPEKEENDVIKDLTITPEPSVLGATDEKKHNGKGMFIAGIFAGLGVIFVFIYLAKPFIIKKFK